MVTPTQILRSQQKNLLRSKIKTERPTPQTIQREIVSDIKEEDLTEEELKQLESEIVESEQAKVQVEIDRLQVEFDTLNENKNIKRESKEDKLESLAKTLEILKAKKAGIREFYELGRGIQTGESAIATGRVEYANIREAAEFAKERNKAIRAAGYKDITDYAKNYQKDLYEYKKQQTELKNLEKEGYKAVYSGGKLVGFEDTKKGMSIGIDQFEKYRESNKPKQISSTSKNILLQQNKPFDLKNLQQLKKVGQGEVNIPKDPTFKEAFSQTKLTIQQQGLFQGVKQGASLFYAATFKPTEKEIKKEEEEREKTEKVLTKIESEEKIINLGGGFQTTPKINLAGTTQLSTEQQLIEGARSGDPSSLNILAELAKKRLSEKTEKVADIEIKKDQKIINDLVKKGASQEEINSKVMELDSSRPERVEKIMETDLNKEQMKLNKIAKQGQITNIVIGTAYSFVLGAGVGGALALAPKLIRTGAAITGGIIGAKETQELAVDVSKGEAGAIEVVGFGLTTGAFIAGAGFANKAVGKIKTPTENLKLNQAINRADLVSNTKGLITEGEIAKLNIPENAKAELKGRIKGGSSARIIEVDLKPSTAADKTLIDKELPYRKIQFVEVTDSLGNVVKRVAIGKIEIQGKGKVFKESIIAESEGFINPQGVLETDTLTRILNKKGVKEAIYTQERTTGGTRKAGNIKISTSKADVKLIEKISTKGKKPLTQAEIKNLLLSVEEGKPLSESRFLELQRRVKIKGVAVKYGNNVILAAEEKSLAAGIGVSRQPQQQRVRVSKSPKTPFSKTFQETEKIIKNQQVNTEKQIKKINKIVSPKIDIKKVETPQQSEFYGKGLYERTGGGLDIGSLGSSNIEAGVRASLQRGINANVLLQPQLPLMNLDEKNIQKELSKLSARGFQDQKLLQDIFQEQNLRSNLLQPQALNLKQNQQLNQQIRQLARQTQIPNIQFPNFNTPNIEIPIIKPIFERPETPTNLPKAIEKELKKQEKADVGYAASLSEAAFGGTPLELTPEQLKKLSKQQFSGFELRPVIALKRTKKKTSKKKKK